MEEIDAIIIDSLRNLHCDLDQDITSLKHFDAEMVFRGISLCLKAITPDSHFPKSLPPSMSHKLKLTSSLASQIKDLGFRDDIGYQTILYCNEAEIRRVLMFLVERLPREASKVAHVEQTGFVPNLVKEIEQKVRDSLQQFWVPSCVLRNGLRKSESGYIVHSLGGCRPLVTTTLQVPCESQNCQNDSLKEYWIRNVPVVTECGPKLIPSLLFKDCLIKSGELKSCFKVCSELPIQNDLVEMPESEVEPVEPELETKVNTLLQQLGEKKQQYQSLQKSVKISEEKLLRLSTNRSEEEEALQNVLSQISLKSKTLTVISKEENLQKLKNMIETSKNKLVSLTEQWHKIQTPLLEEYKSLQNAISSKDLQNQQEQQRVTKLQETLKTLNLDFHEKTQLEDQLRKKLEQTNKTHTRSGYTRRILEIIGNIKKQDEEIQKILKDTREVQREISSLTGQVDRSFTLADELIFRDAKNDETARKAYKFLAQLREDCLSIIKAVTDLGAVERECRNLQEQIDSETSKESAVKLERVNKDLQEIRKETETLLKQT